MKMRYRVKVWRKQNIITDKNREVSQAIPLYFGASLFCVGK